MDVKVSSRNPVQRSKLSPSEKKKQVKSMQDDYNTKKTQLTEDLTESLSNILLGEKIPLDVVNGETSEIIIPANRKITKTLLRKLASVYKSIEIDPSRALRPYSPMAFSISANPSRSTSRTTGTSRPRSLDTAMPMS